MGRSPSLTKRALRAIGVLVLVLVAVLVGNTLRKAPRAQGSAPAPTGDVPVDASKVAEHLAAAIRQRTISHENAQEDDPGRSRRSRSS